MKGYKGVKFISEWFNQSLDNLPPNIKYLDLSNATRFKKELNNLPAGLIGIALFSDYPENNIAGLPHGLKLIFINTNFKKWNLNYLMAILPSSVEYIVIDDKIHVVDMAHKEVKKILINNVHTRDHESHIIFDVPFSYKYKYPMGF
jgi:hypothetical protein